MKPLYALVEQHKALAALDPEEIDEETLLATLEGLEGEIALKAQSCAGYILNVEAFAEAVGEAAKKMKARADKINARAEKVREYLIKQMEAMGTTKIETPEFVMKIKKNPPSLIIDDESKVPSQFKYFPIVSMAIDKKAIKEALDHGDEVPGARLYQGKRIEIKE